MTEPHAYQLEETPPRNGRSTTYFDRWDLVAILALTAIAFVLRFFSPILPDFFAHPLDPPAISNCVSNTPVDPQGDKGTLCGLAYPFNRGYADPTDPKRPLSPPSGQVFDEIYFPVDAYADFKNTRCPVHSIYCPYFDPEPPLAKLVIGAGMWADGWYRATFQGATGDYIDLGYNTFGWRIAACIFGTLCIPMMYLFARRLWPNRLFAIAAATLACFDGMFFIQSRIGMIDIFPIFLILLAYFLFLVHIQSRTPRAALISLVALGTVLGVGISSKWIVLAAWASILFFLIARAFWSWSKGEKLPVPGGVFLPSYLAVAVAALIAIPAALYVASWFPFFLRGQFQNLAELIDYQQQSFSYHAHLTATHAYGSPAWSWPLLARPVLYYAEYSLGFDQWTGQPLWARMENLGNPWIWWTSLPCVLSLPYFIVRYRSFPAALILIGFITQYLPWWPITRVLFMYHMFGGLIFMILALAFVLTHFAEKLRPPGREGLIAIHLATAVLIFGYFYPMWSAVPISESAWFLGTGTPPWGPKMWFVHCLPEPENQLPQLSQSEITRLHLFCWN